MVHFHLVVQTSGQSLQEVIKSTRELLQQELLTEHGLFWRYLKNPTTAKFTLIIAPSTVKPVDPATVVTSESPKISSTLKPVDPTIVVSSSDAKVVHSTQSGGGSEVQNTETPTASLSTTSTHQTRRTPGEDSTTTTATTTTTTTTPQRKINFHLSN